MNNKIIVLVGSFVLLLVLAGGGYFFYQASINQQAVSIQTPSIAPAQIKLTITSPLPNSQVSTNQIIVKGQTLPLADVIVNDAELKADAAGNFSATVNLEEGENPILIIASDASGNYSEQEITVTYVK